MSHKYALEVLDRTLQDLRGNETIMGGVVVLLAGDFVKRYQSFQEGQWLMK